ncbi:MAG: hypothetical protein QXJ28_01755, partial [Candidatus Pacearchaeota archaeon]
MGKKINILIKTKDKEIKIGNVVVASRIGKFTGLMFSKKEKAQPILMENIKSPLHSFFVFFPFVAIWMDEENRVIKSRVVYPFSPYEHCN